MSTALTGHYSPFVEFLSRAESKSIVTMTLLSIGADPPPTGRKQQRTIGRSNRRWRTRPWPRWRLWAFLGRSLDDHPHHHPR